MQCRGATRGGSRRIAAVGRGAASVAGTSRVRMEERPASCRRGCGCSCRLRRYPRPRRRASTRRAQREPDSVVVAPLPAAATAERRRRQRRQGSRRCVLHLPGEANRPLIVTGERPAASMHWAGGRRRSAAPSRCQLVIELRSAVHCSGSLGRLDERARSGEVSEAAATGPSRSRSSVAGRTARSASETS